MNGLTNPPTNQPPHLVMGDAAVNGRATLLGSIWAGVSADGFFLPDGDLSTTDGTRPTPDPSPPRWATLTPRRPRRNVPTYRRTRQESMAPSKISPQKQSPMQRRLPRRSREKADSGNDVFMNRDSGALTTQMN